MSKELFLNYKVIIFDVVFKVCKIRLDSGVLMNYVDVIIKLFVWYNYLKIDVKMMIILDNISEVYWDDVWNGR